MMRDTKDFVTNGIAHILSFLEAFLVILISVFSVLLGFSVTWMFKTWKYLTMDELVYQLNAPITGTNEDMILDYINFCIPGTLIFLVLALLMIIALYRRKKIYHISLAVLLIFSIGFSAYFLHVTWERLDVENYLKNQNTYSTFIDDNYVDAKDITIQFPETKRNLIYIFLESMEVTYTDIENGGAFEEGCIPELTRLAQENEDFSGTETALNGGYSMPKTTWTMGAMFAQTSGLPLSIPSDDGNAMENQEIFFPEITTIGDILQQAGYSQTLLIGSDATFGGRRLYFTEHGNYNIEDYNYAVENDKLPEDYRVWWGYEDDKLFGFAKEKLLELAEGDQPFNLTMLTVDTHFEDGYLCEDCEDDFEDNQYANVMSCSSKKVAEFVAWIQQQDFYENTTIVIVGDHPTMDSDFCEDVDSEYVRKVYTTYINSAVETRNPDKVRNYTTFDNYPTTLASLGVQIEGNRLGLGTNLFSDELTLVEKYGRSNMEQELCKKSELMKMLASDIVIEENKENNVAEEEDIPSAEIAVLDYNYEIGALPVLITNIQNVPGGIVAVNVAVWTNDDQSDLQWMQAVQQEDESYIMNIDVPNFDYKTGDYHVDVYAVMEDGEQTMLGSVIEFVE